MGTDLAMTSLVLSVGVGGIAVVLGLLQWSQWANRDTDLAEVDQVYFTRQDFRRALGVLLMLLLAVGIFVGSRVSPVIPILPTDVGINPEAVGPNSRRANPQFLTIWLGVITLLVTLLGLALFDWFATRHYAHRLRQSMARERLDVLRETFRRTDTNRNGPSN